MPSFFTEHRDGSGLTINYYGGQLRPIKIIGPIPDDQHARDLRLALDRLEKVLAATCGPPREKVPTRGRVKRRK